MRYFAQICLNDSLFASFQNSMEKVIKTRLIILVRDILYVV